MPEQPIEKKAPPEKGAAGDNNVINGAAKVENISEVHADAGSVAFYVMNQPDDFSKVAVNGADHGGRSPAGAETVKTLADYAHLRITKEKDIPKGEPVILIGESPVAAPGNITAITAESKAGKTALTNTMAALSISDTGEIDDFTGMRIRPNTEKKAFIGIDTEQSEEDQQFNVRNSLWRIGAHSTPDLMQCYNIRVMPQEEYLQFTSDIFELCAKEFGGIHLAIIDGGADYTPEGANDEKESIAKIAFFIELAVRYHCAILIVIHLNENAGKNGDNMPRGFLGRQAVRKGYAQLNITKKGDISTLQVLRARKAGADTPLINYKYCAEKGYHVTVDGEPQKSIEDKRAEKEAAALEAAKKMALQILPAPLALRNTELQDKIMAALSCSEATANRHIRSLRAWGIIELGADKFYRLIGK